MKELLKSTYEALCNKCDNYRDITFQGKTDKACYCGMNPLNCVLAKKLNMGR